MRTYIQWATAVPRDFQPLDATTPSHVRSLPRKPVPTRTSRLTGSSGWLADLIVQGVSFAGWDHVAILPESESVLRIAAWNDDPEDYPDGPDGHVWTFLDPAPDPRYGGQVNTRQLLTVYSDVPAQVEFWTGQATSGGPVEVRPWADFPMPDADVTFHGIWQTDEKFAAHRLVQTPHGWREWVR